MDDFTISPDTTGLITVGGTATGDIETEGDRDWFAITLEENTRYVFDLKGQASGNGTLFDPFLRLIDADGIELAANDDSGSNLDSRLFGYTAPTSGMFFLSAGAFGDGGTGTYTLFADALIDTIAGDETTDATISLGQTAEGGLEFDGDSDWYAVTLEGGTLYTAQLLNQDGFFTPVLGLYDENGLLLNEVTAPDFSTAATIETFTPDASGTFFLSASGQDQFDGSPETYSLQVLSLEPITEVGSAGPDTLTGGAGPDTLTGLDGNDRLEGFDRADFLDGGNGNDELLGGGGDDTLLGGAGRDSIAGSDGNDSIDGGSGENLIGAGAGDDTIRGGDDSDGIRAGRGNDLVFGGGGDDRLSGGDGRDILLGGTGMTTSVPALKMISSTRGAAMISWAVASAMTLSFWGPGMTPAMAVSAGIRSMAGLGMILSKAVAGSIPIRSTAGPGMIP